MLLFFVAVMKWPLALRSILTVYQKDLLVLLNILMLMGRRRANGKEIILRLKGGTLLTYLLCVLPIKNAAKIKG